MARDFSISAIFRRDADSMARRTAGFFYISAKKLDLDIVQTGTDVHVAPTKTPLSLVIQLCQGDLYLQ